MRAQHHDETGIGAWTDRDPRRQRPDGSAILGLHPAAYYRQMTDAVVAYMRSMPAVGNRIDPIVGSTSRSWRRRARLTRRVPRDAHALRCLAGGVGFEFAHHGLVSPNITPDPATGTGTRYRRAWSQLMPADAAELAKYIKSVPAVNHEITERLDVVTHR